MAATFKFERETGTGLNRLPTADEIAAMTPEQAEATLVAATSVLPLLVARAKETRPADAPEWITVGDAAELSGMSRFFSYDHWKELPFCRKIGRSVKLNRRGLGSGWKRKRQRETCGQPVSPSGQSQSLHRLAPGWPKRWKSTKTSLAKEAKGLRDEFLSRVRASGLTRDERITYEQIRQVYVDHCTVRDRAASLETFLDTRAKHLDQFFGGMRAIEISQTGAIGQFIAHRKRGGASNASINRELQILGQMFRLAADDEHRLIGRGLVPQIRKLEEPPPRQGVVTEKQFAEILSKLPAWAVAPIKAINITDWRVRAVLSRRKTDVDLERGFLILDRESSKNRTAYKWPLSGDLGDLVRVQVAQIALEERKLGRVIAWVVSSRRSADSLWHALRRLV